MLLSEPLTSLITFFRTSLIKFNLNSQRMSDSFYNWIKRIKLKNKGTKHSFGHINWNFCVGWCLDVNICTVRSMTSWNLISHVCKTRKFVMAILNKKQRLLWDKKKKYLTHALGFYYQTVVRTLYWSLLHVMKNSTVLFRLGMYKILDGLTWLCIVLYGLIHYQMTNFRLFQTKNVCRRQFQIWRKWQKVIQMGRKHCG